MFSARHYDCLREAVTPRFLIYLPCKCTLLDCLRTCLIFLGRMLVCGSDRHRLRKKSLYICLFFRIEPVPKTTTKTLKGATARDFPPRQDRWGWLTQSHRSHASECAFPIHTRPSVDYPRPSVSSSVSCQTCNYFWLIRIRKSGAQRSNNLALLRPQIGLSYHIPAKARLIVLIARMGWLQQQCKFTQPPANEATVSPSGRDTVRPARFSAETRSFRYMPQ